MGYIENNLVKDEQVVETGYVHPFVFVPGLIVAGVGVLLAAMPEVAPVPIEIKTPVYAAGGMLLLWAAWLLGSAAIIKATTVMALTTRRIIARTGLIWKRTVDISYPRIESVNIEQSILGGMLGYGTLIINGIGGNASAVSDIRQPQNIRMKALEMIDAEQKKKS